jgi:1-acyl-sn-glycerol-3-phosphate acyltransferase
MTEANSVPAEFEAAPDPSLHQEGGAALGRDPFSEIVETDPFGERLDLLIHHKRVRPKRRRGPQDRQVFESDEFEASTQQQDAPSTSARTRRQTTTPTLAEVDLPALDGWLDRLLPEHERRVLTALFALVDGASQYDRFGFSPEVTRRAFPFAYALYRLYFRVKSSGHEHLPREGPAILAGNHGGLLPFDAVVGIVDVALHTDPPRLSRAIVDLWAGELPWINILYARLGQVIGTRENFAELLSDGQLVLVYPEGIEGIRKTISQRYQVQEFRVGFIEQALRERAPIVPVAFVGSDDQAPILYDIKPLAKRLGLPFFPITPTFPWLGPLGLLPYPVSYKIVYGEPLEFYRTYSAEDADDPRLVRYLAKQVRHRVQTLISRNRS